MSTAYDAVVVGAGPNGLVAANRLVDAGWSVLVLEAASQVGGAVRSDTDVHAGFVHDTFSAFYPLALASPAIRPLDLESHGLVWRRAPAVLGHPLPDGGWALLHRDREVTAANLDAYATGDGEAWLDLCRSWDAVGQSLMDALLSPFPPVRPALGVLRGLPRAHPRFARALLGRGADPRLWPFRGEAARLLLAGSAGHTDLPLDAVGSGLMGTVIAMLGQTLGFPVPEGGSGRLSEALARRLESRGGEIRCSTPVTRIAVEGRRAVAVESADGRRTTVARAVLAAVTAPLLYGGLVAEGDLPRRVVWGMRRFRLDPGTVKVDWALSGPVPWRDRPAYAPGTVHVGDGVAEIAEAMAQVEAGSVPARPFLLVGQMTTTDPTRSPDGTESMWAYTHVPQHVTGDAGGEGLTGSWDHDECERFADRVQARIEAHAPGFGARVLARRVLGPRELEARDACLVGGSLNGGTGRLRQQVVLRPVPGLARAETGIGGLYLASSSAHPGGGVHGAAGMNAARAALAHDRVRRLVGHG